MTSSSTRKHVNVDLRKFSEELLYSDFLPHEVFKELIRYNDTLDKPYKESTLWEFVRTSYERRQQFLYGRRRMFG